MKQSLQLKLSQHLTLTPQLQQSIKLLQLSTLELNQEIERFLQDNPLLERDDSSDEDIPVPQPGAMPGSELTPPSTQATTSTDSEDRPEGSEPEMEWGSDEGGGGGGGDDGEDGDYPQVAANEPSLREHLIWQMNLLKLSERDRLLLSLLVDCLDDDGYLTADLEELVALLPPERGVDASDLQVALKHLQNMEPAGIGSRSLGECLALQLEALPPQTPYRAEALHTVRNHLDLLAARDYARLKKLLHCTDDSLREIQALVVGLDPRPASRFSNDAARYIIPDVIVKKVRGAWRSALNPDAMPKLRVNRLYADILQRNRDSSMQQLSGQLQEAKWLIKNVQQRFDTILRVSQAIVERQRHFFEHGEVAMRPLVLREIADTLGLHESTVSRVTTQKFMLTPRGIFELKYFFGSHVTTETGGACSATAIRALIKQLVGEEDRRKPLSDSQISEILGKQGIVVARRTIAKYRESLQILPVNLRKAL